MASIFRYAGLALLTLLWGAGAVTFPALRAIPFPLSMTVAIILDRGVSLKTILSLLAAGVLLELLWALPQGTIIGPQLCSAALLILAERILIMPPMVLLDSWRFSAILLRMVLGTLTVIAGLAIWATSYTLLAHEPLMNILRSLGDGYMWAGTAVASCIGIIVLHHARVPFRKRITFGSPYA